MNNVTTFVHFGWWLVVLLGQVITLRGLVSRVKSMKSRFDITLRG